MSNLNRGYGVRVLVRVFCASNFAASGARLCGVPGLCWPISAARMQTSELTAVMSETAPHTTHHQCVGAGSRHQS
eukprot:6675334-Prymnesium_polylepis.2